MWIYSHKTINVRDLQLVFAPKEIYEIFGVYEINSLLNIHKNNFLEYYW